MSSHVVAARTMPVVAPGYAGRFDVIGWYLVRYVVRMRRSLPRAPPSLVDVGMGRGRDLIWFARCGFRVFGIDRSPELIDRAERRARRLGVEIETQLGDFRTVRLRRRFDVVYSSCTLNHLPARQRARQITRYQEATAPGGLHAVNAMLRDTRPPRAPDLEPGWTPFEPGELQRYYQGWSILDAPRQAYACRAGGRSHRHLVDVVVARKPGAPPDPVGK